MDHDFEGVMRGCAGRKTGSIAKFYGLPGASPSRYSTFGRGLHNEELVGGLYGVSLGAAFFAESKFHIN